MKKSELRGLIRECVKEVLSEAFLMRKFKDFVGQSVPANMRDDFIVTLYPFFNKTAENPEQQAAYAQKIIDAAIGKPLSAKDKEYFRNHDVDLDDKQMMAMLSRFHPFLSEFLKYIQKTG